MNQNLAAIVVKEGEYENILNFTLGSSEDVGVDIYNRFSLYRLRFIKP